MTVGVLLWGAVWSVGQQRSGVGLPTIAVLGTVAVWYVGDAFYNDYVHNHAQRFQPEVLAAAWWQVALFLVSFLLLVGPTHRWLNARCNRKGEHGHHLAISNALNKSMVIRRRIPLPDVRMGCYVFTTVFGFLNLIFFCEQSF